jgi:hypothetical protein
MPKALIRFKALSETEFCELRQLEPESKVKAAIRFMALALAVSKGMMYSKRISGLVSISQRPEAREKLIKECSVLFDMLVESNSQEEVFAVLDESYRANTYNNWPITYAPHTDWFYRVREVQTTGGYKVARAIVRRALTGGKPAGKRAQLLPLGFVVPAWGKCES